MAMSAIVSTQNRVESPFIIVKIGNYTFGHCSDIASRAKLGARMNVVFPNFMQSINIVKINGAVNTYKIKMDYAITETDDPNLLEKVFGSVSRTRSMVLSYGDWDMPSFIYKEEEAIITKVTSNVDFKSSKITYNISAVSTSLSLKAGTFSFGARNAKPSDVIYELLNNEAYGLKEVFTGMRNMTKTQLSNLIAGDDKKVAIEAKESISPFDYISYLCNCMVSTNDSGGALKKSNYYWAVYDDTSNKMGGTYFKVVRVDAGAQYNVSYNTYEVDIGYPSGNYVSDFTINSDKTWSILYDYSQDISLPQYTYTIDKTGEVKTVQSNTLTNSSKYLRTTEADKTWWSQMTQFPITARLTIKGLLRPAMLMSYVKVNTYFYGHKHISSGLYIITKQEDSIDNSGYKTTLSLTRISGDTNA